MSHTFRDRYEAAPPAARDAMRIGAVPVTFSPTVSVVIATVNEGPDLEATLALLCASSRKPDEIVVVDNGSREPLEPRVRPFGRWCDLKVIRQERNLGSGRGKTVGLDAATGDLLIVMDSHLRPRWEFIQIALDAFQQYPYSLFCPWSFGFTNLHPKGKGAGGLPGQATFAGRGARFMPGPHGFLDMRWNLKAAKPQDEPDHCAVIGCILGGCYAFGRELMLHLGGYNRHMVGWGAEQEWASLRAWIAGFDCRLLNTPVEHHYQPKDGPRPDRVDATGAGHPNWGTEWHNRHFLSACAWEDESFHANLCGPMMKAHHWNDGLRDALAASEPAIREMRAHIARIRRRSDAEVCAALGLEMPKTIEEYRAYYARKGWQPRM